MTLALTDQYQYLGNCLPTPPLTQQQSIDNKLRLMLGLGRGRWAVAQILILIRSDDMLALETSALEALYEGQFTLSTQLIKPYSLAISTTDVAPQFLQKLNSFTLWTVRLFISSLTFFDRTTLTFHI